MQYDNIFQKEKWKRFYDDSIRRETRIKGLEFL